MPTLSPAPPRPWVTIGLAGALAVGLAGLQQGTVSAEGREPDRPALHTQAVAVAETGERVGLDASGLIRLIGGTRALDPATAAAQRAWLAEGTVPGAGGPWADMGHDALVDLSVLTLGNGAALAGWSPRWRYVWPRDASFVVAALARTGHTEDAERVLTFLQRARPTGSAAALGFQARYLPDGSGQVPDDRGVEADGAGWLLWAAAELADAVPVAERAALASRLEPLLTTATIACLSAVERGGGLPPPGPDYWEIPERRASLGLAGPVLAGLEAAPGLLAAVTFLLPPFRVPGGGQDPRLTTAWAAAQVELRRPAGGLAPGAGWRRDGVSWTPETALFALTAAHGGRRDVAAAWLSWLDAHRTRGGALPEKVLADGSPAAVAPLAWTAALVVLTLDAL